MSDERTLDLLEAKIEELKQLDVMDGIELTSEITKLEKKLVELRKELYANLSDWERVKIARNPKATLCSGLHPDVVHGVL